jgi:hypothetical protein
VALGAVEGEPDNEDIPSHDGPLRH